MLAATIESSGFLIKAPNFAGSVASAIRKLRNSSGEAGALDCAAVTDRFSCWKADWVAASEGSSCCVDRVAVTEEFSCCEGDCAAVTEALSGCEADCEDSLDESGVPELPLFGTFMKNPPSLYFDISHHKYATALSSGRPDRRPTASNTVVEACPSGSDRDRAHSDRDSGTRKPCGSPRGVASLSQGANPAGPDLVR
jgi:hypothetical protein